MPSLRTTIVALLAATVAALPPTVRLSPRQLPYHTLAKRQQEQAQPSGLSDFDILQFALTLEHLESAFYQQGFAKFPAEDFKALGLSDLQISDLTQIGKTEQQHVGLLQSSLAQGGVKPVEPCTYSFNFTDAAGMIATAAVLESIGVSAYLGAAPLLLDKAILGTAGSILTIEARHQTAIRIVSKQAAVPDAFDVPLTPRAVFTMAAPFIASCPEGSSLKIEAFPGLAMEQGAPAAAAPAGKNTSVSSSEAGGAAAAAAAGNSTSVGGEAGGAAAGNSTTTTPSSKAGGGAAPGALAVGSRFRVSADASASASAATRCGFTCGGVVPGDTAFSNFTQAEGCTVPQGVAGVCYVTLTNNAPLSGALTDALIVAGPMPVVIS